MAGISDQTIKTQYAVNKYRFQKQELQNKEFSDGSGLEMYEFKYRMDDPQIGRFWSVDPLSSKYVYNSPYAFSEDKVTSHLELEGLEAVALKMLWGEVKSEFNNFGKQVDHTATAEVSHDHMVSKEKKSENTEVKKSVETTNTFNLNFGMGDFMEHLTRTNTTSGGPSLKLEIDEKTEVKDKTTTTTKLGPITVTGVESTSRTDGSTEQGVTVSGGVKAGDIPNATLGFGFVTNSNGLSTFTTSLSGSGTIGNTTYSAGAETSISGQNKRGTGSVNVSVYGQTSTDSDTYRSTLRLKIF